MSQASSDDFLIDLFREEVRTNCQVLADGLVALEQGNISPDRLEAMMRAAHSIKGAARVVNLPAGVEVSHALEDCFVRAQKAELTLTSIVVDVLLAGVDMLQGIAAAAGAGFAAWLESHQPEIALLLQRLDDVAPGNKAQASPGPAFADKQAMPIDSVQASVRQESVVPPAAPAPDVEISPQSTAPITGQKSAATSADESVVRVTARSLTRLMGLAGESLVEARWLQPFSKSLLQLKNLQARLAGTVESLAGPDRSEITEEQLAALSSDAREQLAACRDLLADRIGEFDRRIRNTDDLSSRLYHEVISSRMRPFRDGVQGLPRLVRDLARQMGKKAQLEIRGESTEVDRDILERLDAPLNHLVRNALDHALETPEERLALGKPEIGRLTIEAAHRAGLLLISISDDGRGIDLERLRAKIVDRGLAGNDVAGKLSEAELLDFLFLPGFSTAAEVTEISGRGVGLDVVHSMVQSAGGHVRVHSKPGRGTSFQIELPVTLSVLRAVVVDIAGEPYALPHNRIDQIIRVSYAELHSLENRQYFEIDGQNVGIVMARQVFQLEGPIPEGEDLLVVLFSNRSAKYGLVVDGLQGEQDLVVRPVDRRLGKVPNLHAFALLDDGSPVLIVDPEDLCSSIEKLLQGHRLQRAGGQTAQSDDRRRKSILVVDDSITVREVERQLLANQGYEVEVAVDGMEGWNMAREGRFDLVISDIDMPRLNGLDLVRKIKADARLQAIPVVIVSYKDREEDRLRGLEAGANHYLTKSSFHDDTFVQTVRELIGSPEE
jgi:two-component system, chemotaxis family, sensor histidine kinase and response regulator WspE